MSRSPVLVSIPRRILFESPSIPQSPRASMSTRLTKAQPSYLSSLFRGISHHPCCARKTASPVHLVECSSGTGSYAPSALRLAHASGRRDEHEPLLPCTRMAKTGKYTLLLLYTVESGPRLMLLVSNWLYASHGLSVLLMVCASCAYRTFFAIPDLASRSTAHAKASG